MSSEQQKPKVLVISGTTNSGKTEISIEIAKKLNGEIINADSVQIFKGLKIGADKVDQKILDNPSTPPHHLLDLVDPRTNFDAKQFYVLAREKTEVSLHILNHVLINTRTF